MLLVKQKQIWGSMGVIRDPLLLADCALEDMVSPSSRSIYWRVALRVVGCSDFPSDSSLTSPSSR